MIRWDRERCRDGLKAAETDICRRNIMNLTLLVETKNAISRDVVSDIGLHVNF
jgi:hypothetical protein